MSNPSLADILRVLGEEVAEAAPMPSKEEQEATLAAFIPVPPFAVGDKVVRNGNRYRFPNDTQIAVVSDLYTGVVFDDRGRRVHGEIAIVSPFGVEPYPVDFRFYKAA